MKRKLLYIGFVFVLVSCVSKSKYNKLKQTHEQSLNDKVDLETVLNKVSVENDSLKRRIAMLDSLLPLVRSKSVAASPAPGGEVSSKPKTTLSKTVEYDTKALYVYNIPNYIFWPNSIKATRFLIGVIGDSKLNGALAGYMYGKNIHRMPVVVEPYVPATGKFYHMLFIAESKEKDFTKIKKDLQNQPVLLLVENQNLEKLGAHISIYAEGDKIKFRVNKKQIEKSGLNVSESLIKLSQGTQ